MIAGAARAFATRGYHNTSLNSVAASLQVTKPTLSLLAPSVAALNWMGHGYRADASLTPQKIADRFIDVFNQSPRGRD